MKIFLSWSGSLSHQVARELRSWLPSVLQALKPYVSSEDIDKGARWSTDIAGELENSSYGIICVTKENLDAPWVHFEAGALSKSLEQAQVVPFLFGVKRSEVRGPLLQFQSVIFDKEDIRKLIRGLNDRLGEAERLGEEQIGKAFEVWWPQLEESLGSLIRAPSTATDRKANDATIVPNEAILEELLELSRANQRILNNPEQLIPRAHLADLMLEFGRANRRDTLRAERYLDSINKEAEKVMPVLEEAAAMHPELEGLRARLLMLQDVLKLAMGKDPWSENTRLLTVGELLGWINE